MKTNHKIFQWAVVGAGPAGIAAVGKLLDEGISPDNLLWLDPAFQVGDFGTLWKNVSSNTTVKLFTHFLQAVHAFSYQHAPIDFTINHLPPDKTCTLNEMVVPLQWITGELGKKVKQIHTLVNTLSLAKSIWSLHTDSTVYEAKNVILATGAIPEYLNYPSIETIPFETAIDKMKLSQAIHPHETYAVFGSSHSAIMMIHYLVDLGVKKIINFYRSPCRYAINMGEWILFDNTGLKGNTAVWAKQYIDGVLPSNLVRYISHTENIQRFLPECDKALYAVGFKRRGTITIEGYDHQYDTHVGIIAPGLFGFGIAYPEVKSDPFGHIESQVGLWKFMVYLNKVLPIWFKYPA